LFISILHHQDLHGHPLLFAAKVINPVKVASERIDQTSQARGICTRAIWQGIGQM